MTAIPTPSFVTVDPAPRLVFGPGAVAEVGPIVRDLGVRRALLVTDPGVAAAGVAARVEAACAAAGVAVTVFDRVAPSPTLADVEAGVAAARRALDGGELAVVAVGGGSPMDAAKAIALGAVNPVPVRRLDDPAAVERPGLPIVAVPTTAGTGAETNGFGVVTDTEAVRKVYLGDESTVPVAAVLDPELTLGVPPPVTAATGMDALTHALESLASRRANDVAAGDALRAVELVSAHLATAVADGRDLAARSQLLLAAHLAGRAMRSTGLGLAHAIGHALTNRAGIPHGAALAMVLPAVLRFNLPVRAEAFGAAAGAFRFRSAGSTAPGDRTGGPASAEAAAHRLVDEVAALSAAVGTDRPLRAAGVGPGLVPVLAADAVADVVIANNPRPATEDEVAAVVTAAL